MPEARDLIERHFRVDNGQLMFGGEVSLTRVVQTAGTPVFVYDLDVVRRKLALLRAALPPGFSVSYSVKANPSPPILRHFLSQGCGLEIASAGEYFQARRAGCAAEAIVFAGPGKSETELAEVLQDGIGEIHVESVKEIERIAAIRQQCGGADAHIAIRVNPTGEALGGAMRMGGQSTPFGIDEESLDDVVEVVRATSGVTLRGMHLFSGTQILDHTVLVSQYRKGLQIAKRIVQRTGVPLQTIDFGGGWGIPYFGNETELDTVLLKTGLAELFDEYHGDDDFRDTRFMVEPGRFLVGESGVYISQVIDIKVSRGKKFLIVDGGMHQHLAASGNFGQVIKKNFPVSVLNRLDQDVEDTVDVVGPLCTPLDVLARGIQVPHVEIGDYIGVLQSGAYARTASPLQFLSHRAPPEVIVEQGAMRVVRRRGTYEDMVDDCVDA